MSVSFCELLQLDASQLSGRRRRSSARLLLLLLFFPLVFWESPFVFVRLFMPAPCTHASVHTYFGKDFYKVCSGLQTSAVCLVNKCTPHPGPREAGAALGPVAVATAAKGSRASCCGRWSCVEGRRSLWVGTRPVLTRRIDRMTLTVLLTCNNQTSQAKKSLQTVI